MSGTKILKKTDAQTNYSFLLQVMMGLTAAAVITAGVLAVMAAKASTTAAAAGFVATSTAVGGPIGAIAAIAALAAIVAAAILLPFLFRGNRPVAYSTTSVPYSSSLYSRPWGFGLFNPSTVYAPCVPAYPTGVHHHGTHPGGIHHAGTHHAGTHHSGTHHAGTHPGPGGAIPGGTHHSHGFR